MDTKGWEKMEVEIIITLHMLGKIASTDYYRVPVSTFSSHIFSKHANVFLVKEMHSRYCWKGKLEM